MFVVAGVSGNTGAVAARILLQDKQPVRVLVRDAKKGEPWKQLGAEVAVASLDDAASLQKAFAGAKGAYVLSPPDATTTDLVANRKPYFEAIAKAAKQSGLPHLVLLSSIGAQHERGTGPIASLHLAERLLGDATALTAIRAGYFLENWAAVLPAAKGDGVLPSFIPESLQVPTVAVADIGRVAAEALRAGPKGRRIVELGADTSPKQIAEALTQILGKQVKVQVAPPAAAAGAFQSFGFSAHMAGLYAEMYQGIVEGHVAFEGKERGKTVVTLSDGLRLLLG